MATKYVMKKPRPTRRAKILLTLDQHALSQRLMDKIKDAKNDIVVASIFWEEAAASKARRGSPTNAQNANNTLEHLRQCIVRYKKLMTFPKRAEGNE